MNSAIQPNGFNEDYSIDELEAVELNAATTKGLAASQIRFIKSRVIDANEAISTAGSAIYAAAQALSDIKSDVKNKNWTALTDSGALQMSGRMARDLVSAFETWMRDADIPENALAQVSTRTLAKIGKADAGKRVHAINKIKKGEGFTDSDLTKILGNAKSPTRKLLDEIFKDAEVYVKKESKENKIRKFGEIYLENIRLKQEVKALKDELSVFKNLKVSA